MELKDLRYFVEIVDQKSMRKAAANLYISQPNLSRVVQGLEKELGASLLNRNNKGVGPTEIGEGFYLYAKSILEQVDGISMIRLQNEKYIESRISIALGKLIMCDDMIFQYYEAVKSDHTGINIVETTIEDVLNRVEKTEADIGIVTVNNMQTAAFHKLAEIKELETHEISKGPLYIQIGERNPYYYETSIDIEKLLPFSYICLEVDYFANLNTITRIDGKIKITDFPKKIRMNNYHAIINMIKKTESFLFGNKWQIEELKKGGINSLLLNNCEVTQHLMWVKRKREVLSRQAEMFLKLFVEYYAD